MAIVTPSTREIMFGDGTVAKFNAGETTQEVITALEAMGYVVNVF